MSHTITAFITAETYLVDTDTLSADAFLLNGRLWGQMELILEMGTSRSLSFSALSQANATSTPISKRAPLRRQTERVGGNHENSR